MYVCLYVCMYDGYVCACVHMVYIYIVPLPLLMVSYTVLNISQHNPDVKHKTDDAQKLTQLYTYADVPDGPDSLDDQMVNGTRC